MKVHQYKRKQINLQHSIIEIIRKLPKPLISGKLLSLKITSDLEVSTNTQF